MEQRKKLLVWYAAAGGAAGLINGFFGGGGGMILVPLLAFALLHNLISNQLILGIVIVALCMPTATNATNISYLSGGNHDFPEGTLRQCLYGNS